MLSLLSAIKNLSPFNFVQIGGFDGCTGDPIHQLVTDHKIPGVIVEPQPAPFQRLTQTYANRPDIKLINAAVDWKAGDRTMYVIEPGHDEHPWVYQLASFRKEVVLHHCETLPAIRDWIQEITIPCLTIEDILKAAGYNEIGLLQVDTEGYDAEIISMAWRLGLRPKVIHYEYFHLDAYDKVRIEKLLELGDYTLTRGRMDVLAIKEEQV